MDMIHIVQVSHDIGAQMLDISLLAHLKHGMVHWSVADWTLLAQQFDTDPFAGFREWSSNLVASGQLWALIIGFIVGYLFRGFTSYG